MLHPAIQAVSAFRIQIFPDVRQMLKPKQSAVGLSPVRLCRNEPFPAPSIRFRYGDARRYTRGRTPGKKIVHLELNRNGREIQDDISES